MKFLLVFENAKMITFLRLGNKLDDSSRSIESLPGHIDNFTEWRKVI